MSFLIREYNEAGELVDREATPAEVADREAVAAAAAASETVWIAQAVERTSAGTDLRTTAADVMRRLDEIIAGWATATAAQRQDATLDAIRALRRLMRYVVAQAT